jgi:hypothetical protein
MPPIIQAEGSRAEYLFDVLVAAGERDRLEAPILAALAERELWDREQLLDLAPQLHRSNSHT